VVIRWLRGGVFPGNPAMESLRDVAPEKRDEIMNWITAFKPTPIITIAELKFWGQSAD
jgi:hypothetical protein